MKKFTFFIIFLLYILMKNKLLNKHTNSEEGDIKIFLPIKNLIFNSMF